MKVFQVVVEVEVGPHKDGGVELKRQSHLYAANHIDDVWKHTEDDRVEDSGRTLISITEVSPSITPLT
jgi:hypothetical protein